MSRTAVVTCSLALGVALSSTLAGCATPPATPGSTDGACALFRDPGRVVRGATPADQRWISATHEAGIAGCGWERPAEEAPAARAAGS